MNNRKDHIIELLSKGRTKDNHISVPIMINFKDIYTDLVDTHKEITKDGITQVTDVIYQVNLIRAKNTDPFSLYVTALQHVDFLDSEGKPVKEPEVKIFYLATAAERALMAEKKKLIANGEQIPDSLLNVKLEDEYPGIISTGYSDVLETYLSDNYLSSLTTFEDCLVPVVELARPTLVKNSVLKFISRNLETWVDLLNDKIQDVMLLTAINDTKQAINNYMNCVANVFAILSARKRGKNVATSDITRSCPELTKEELILDTVTDNLKVSLLSTNLPLFSAEFIRKFLMGNIPLFLISEDSESETAFFGCDLFKNYKERLLSNIPTLITSLKLVSNSNISSEEASLLRQINTGYSQIVMPGMYKNYMKKSGTGFALGKLLNGKYSCFFLDYIIYSIALKVYKNKTVTEFNLFDFLNLVSPVTLTREEI